MPKPARLTDRQRLGLGKLEPALREAARRGDYQSAKRLTAEIQALLRPTGHETRLMKAKNWLFEAAMEAGNLQVAMAGFEGVRQKLSPRTRAYVEATALLAICHIRNRRLDLAEPLIREVLNNDSVIRSDRRRRQFRARVIARFEEEGLLAALQGEGTDKLDPDEIQTAAAQDVQSKTEDEMYADLGRSLPSSTLEFLGRVDRMARRQLPTSEIQYLPPPAHLLKNSELGRRVASSIGRVAWRALCDPESELYKAWYTEGLAFVLSKKYLAASIVGALAGVGIGIKALCVSLVALVLKFGLEVFCDLTRPKGIMIALKEK